MKGANQGEQATRRVAGDAATAEIIEHNLTVELGGPRVDGITIDSIAEKVYAGERITAEDALCTPGRVCDGDAILVPGDRVATGTIPGGTGT